MKKILLVFGLLFAFSYTTIQAQLASLQGTLIDGSEVAVGFANVALYKVADSSLVKAEMSDVDGNFTFRNVVPGIYKLEATFLGNKPIVVDNISLIDNQARELGKLTFIQDAVELETAVVKARRALVEVKPDRTVFNVEGTINSAGDNGMGLLRKAPGVLVDNNDNISVLSRSGVLIYVDGRRLPLNGEALTNYLQNLPAEQIDRIDIITNPGAKYEAEGNAGIIDIRLKRDKSLGSNGSVSLNASQGRYFKGGGSLSGNFRNKRLNAFGSLGGSSGSQFIEMRFENFQNGLLIDERNFNRNDNTDGNFRFGTDFFINKNQTIGFLVTGGLANKGGVSNNFSLLSQGASAPVDSILRAKNETSGVFGNNTFNVNYAWNNGKQSLNVDADYGSYNNEAVADQPNLYYNPAETELLTSVITAYETPVEIDIATFKIDYETPLAGGNFGVGTKLSNVSTDNIFRFYNGEDRVLNNDRSNQFKYSENVYAAYLSYGRSISEKLKFTSGLRAEITDASGELTPFSSGGQEPPVLQNYVSYFPTVGLTYQLSRMQSLSLNYGSRINRPDYNVLNPFRVQMSELSFMKGNAFLVPEIVHNAELGYTLFYRFNFKFAYSKTYNQITRLIAPDETDERAGFITWANLAEQDVFSFNASLPFQINKWWSLFVNANASRIDNQAEYDDGGVVDVQAYSYSFFQQQTFKLPNKFVAEVSGYYSGPGVWGGVFLYDPNWSLNLGLQRKFFNDKMNVKISVSDLFYQSGWSGESAFNGLVSSGSGQWDSRRASIAISYNFGNKDVKSRKRKTGLEDESKRVSN